MLQIQLFQFSQPFGTQAMLTRFHREFSIFATQQMVGHKGGPHSRSSAMIMVKLQTGLPKLSRLSKNVMMLLKHLQLPTSKAFYKVKHEFMKAQDAVRWAEQVLKEGDHCRHREVIDQLRKLTSPNHQGISAEVNLVGHCFMMQPVPQPELTNFMSATGPMQQHVGIDTDSAVTASNRSEDFLEVNHGSSQYGNSIVSGVGGGSSKIGGMGQW